MANTFDKQAIAAGKPILPVQVEFKGKLMGLFFGESRKQENTIKTGRNSCK